MIGRASAVFDAPMPAGFAGAVVLGVHYAGGQRVICDRGVPAPGFPSARPGETPRLSDPFAAERATENKWIYRRMLSIAKSLKTLSRKDFSLFTVFKL